LTVKKEFIVSASSPVKVRPSVRSLQTEYEQGHKQPLEDLMRAWKGIKELPPTDKRSFFMLGGYHGEPFQYRRQVDALDDEDRYVYWGGYCNHGNVLFPTWHRVYVLKLEEALQSIVPGVMMPYWDQTSEVNRRDGIPWVLTAEIFELDGELIDNPLRSFVLPLELSDFSPGDDKVWEKPQGYETVRYPLSGLVGSAQARATTQAHNDQFPDYDENIKLLNENIVAWMGGPLPEHEPDKPQPQHGITWRYQHCLRAPNYTVFSNTTSAGQWNLDHGADDHVTAVEDPHNDIHLAVGGFDMPKDGEFGLLAGANGDMGENNTAAMDPIFFFHHCNVDRMFWLWQKQNGCTDEFDILQNYAGTNSSDSQGPTPGIPPGTPLSMDTPLNPFLKDGFGTMYTSRDCINIEKQLGYTYAPGSLEEALPPAKPRPEMSNKRLTVRGIDRAWFQGSLVLRAYATVQNGYGRTKEVYLGHASVLSRRNVVHCANCLTHLEVVAHFPLNSMTAADVEQADFHITVQHRGAELPAEFTYTLVVED
jgi:tyrosinase